MSVKTAFVSAFLLALAAAAPATSLRRAIQGVVTGAPANPLSYPGQAGSDKYVMYQGDGTTGAGWPSRDSWVPFEDMFAANKPLMAISCGWMNVPNPTDDEINDIHDGIQQASNWAQVDPRFILAVIMQESKGCVRVHTTGNGVRNPGLMQDHDGAHSCNDPAVGGVLTPCPRDQIMYMISDGTGGTDAGDGLAQVINQASQKTSDATAPFYMAARIYNSGSVAASGNLNDANGATASYACDVANRLMGWVNAASAFPA